MKNLNLALAVLLFSSWVLAQKQTVDVAIIVSGAKANKGQILLSVFSSEENYLKAPTVEAKQSIDENGNAKFLLSLEPQRYSFSAIYDEDNNGELKTGIFGIPKELVGFSNNVKSRFGPPSFSKTSTLIDQDSEVEIVLSNAKD